MTESQDAIVDQIAQALHEHTDEARRHIQMIAAVLGAEQALALLDETSATEAAGGMLVPDGSKRRTPGGVFFLLARRHLTHDQQQQIFGAYWRRVQRERKKLQTSTAPLVATEVEEPFAKIIQTLARGEARTVKVTLVGRPGKAVQKKDTVLLTMENRKSPAMPKGLPAPPASPTLYTVYLTPKHWRKVSESLKNPEDVLIIEGWQAYDPELEGIAVWGLNVTTKLLQQQQREERAAE
jgi:hypothetical protein